MEKEELSFIAGGNTIATASLKDDLEYTWVAFGLGSDPRVLGSSPESGSPQ